MKKHDCWWPWVRVIVRTDDKILLDARYLRCKEDYEVLRDDVLSILATHRFATIEFHEFWAPEAPERKVRYDSGNLFAIR